MKRFDECSVMVVVDEGGRGCSGQRRSSSISSYPEDGRSGASCEDSSSEKQLDTRRVTVIRLPKPGPSILINNYTDHPHRASCDVVTLDNRPKSNKITITSLSKRLSNWFITTNSHDNDSQNHHHNHSTDSHEPARRRVSPISTRLSQTILRRPSNASHPRHRKPTAADNEGEGLHLNNADAMVTGRVRSATTGSLCSKPQIRFAPLPCNPHHDQSHRLGIGSRASLILNSTTPITSNHHLHHSSENDSTSDQESDTVDEESDQSTLCTSDQNSVHESSPS